MNISNIYQIPYIIDLKQLIACICELYIIRATRLKDASDNINCKLSVVRRITSCTTWVHMTIFKWRIFGSS